ncbi:universal stress protein [Streptomyces tauricus]|uniref:universal stress protein n=1 Tax=Streptomyces tauricus TaxID=68274 RepID=UPI0033A97EEB
MPLDTDSPHDTVIEFAFDAATRRGSGLRVVFGWNPPPYYAYGLSADLGLHEELCRQQVAALAEVLRPWREKLPDIEVVQQLRYGGAVNHLVNASREASLVVVGRRIRTNPFGVHIGPITHAVQHHATTPPHLSPSWRTTDAYGRRGEHDHEGSGRTGFR